MNGKTRRNRWDSATKAFSVLQFFEEQSASGCLYFAWHSNRKARPVWSKDRRPSKRLVNSKYRSSVAAKIKTKKRKKENFIRHGRATIKYIFFSLSFSLSLSFLSFPFFFSETRFQGARIARQIGFAPQRERSYNGWHFYFDYLLDEGWPPGKIRSRCVNSPGWIARRDSRRRWFSPSVTLAGNDQSRATGGDTRNIARNKKLCLFNESFSLFSSLFYISLLFLTVDIVAFSWIRVSSLVFFSFFFLFSITARCEHVYRYVYSCALIN